MSDSVDADTLHLWARLRPDTKQARQDERTMGEAQPDSDIASVQAQEASTDSEGLRGSVRTGKRRASAPCPK
jgi:hypothetical protein